MDECLNMGAEIAINWLISHHVLPKSVDSRVIAKTAIIEYREEQRRL